VQLVISDAHAGLRAAIEASWSAHPGKDAECISCATGWPGRPEARPRWSPPPSAPSSPNLTP